jgi:hypothetical protein
MPALYELAVASVTAQLLATSVLRRVATYNFKVKEDFSCTRANDILRWNARHTLLYSGKIVAYIVIAECIAILCLRSIMEGFVLRIGDYLSICVTGVRI